MLRLQLLNSLVKVFARSENDKGNYYPIWGTCLGFDILLMFAKHLPYLKESLIPFPLHGYYPCTFTSTNTKLKNNDASMFIKMMLLYYYSFK